MEKSQPSSQPSPSESDAAKIPSADLLNQLRRWTRPLWHNDSPKSARATGISASSTISGGGGGPPPPSLGTTSNGGGNIGAATLTSLQSTTHSHSTNLSLQSLVLVHDCLLNVISDSALSSAFSTSSLSVLFAPSKGCDTAAVLSPLSHSLATCTHDAERLLVVQCYMRMLVFGVNATATAAVDTGSAVTATTITTTATTSPLYILHAVVLPLLFRHTDFDKNDEALAQEEKKRDHIFSDDLIQALFDASFTLITTTTLSHDTKWLAACVDMLQNVLESVAKRMQGRHTANGHVTLYDWKVACRLLVRLTQQNVTNSDADATHASSNNTTMLLASALAQAVTLGMPLSMTTKTIVSSLSSASASDGAMDDHGDTATTATTVGPSLEAADGTVVLVSSELLGPVIQDVIPTLLQCLTSMMSNPDALSDPADNRDQVAAATSTVTTKVWDSLWHAIWQAYYLGSSSSSTSTTRSCQPPLSTMLTSVTSVLCSLLPSLLQTKMPVLVPTRAVDDNAAAIGGTSATATLRVPPWQVLPLWDLIYWCLHQGLVGSSSSASSTEGSSSSSSPNVYATTESTLHWQRLHRRRGLYLLRLLVQNDGLPRAATTTGAKPSDQSLSPPVQQQQDWIKYVACFETIEMESEPHLVDQVWETVAELFEKVSVVPSTPPSSNQVSDAPPSEPPRLSWDWMKLLLGRILLSPESPVLRKLSLYRLLQGQAGILLHDANDAATNVGTAHLTAKSKKRSGTTKVSLKQSHRGAPLSVVTVDFVFTVILPSFNSLVTSVGTTMQGTAATMAGTTRSPATNSVSVTSNSDSGSSGTTTATTSSSKVAVACDMVQMLCDFIQLYLKRLLAKREAAPTSLHDTATDNELQLFFEYLWSPHVVDDVHDKIVVRIYQAVQDTVQRCDNPPTNRIPIRDDMLQTVTATFQLAFSDGSVVPVYRTALLQALASMLEHSSAVKKYAPQSILGVLALFPVRPLNSPESHRNICNTTPSSRDGGDEAPSWIDEDPALVSICKWLSAESGADTVGATVATAFVDGMLLSTAASSDWDPGRGCTQLEHNMARAVALFCFLPTLKANSKTAGECLWPAIHKGLSLAPGAIGLSWTKADRVARALLLLENGVKLQILSGMGNGDLVVDKKTQQMLPPPPNIEAMLSNSVTFILQCLRNLVNVDGGATSASDDKAYLRGSRSSDARMFSSTFGRLVDQLVALSVGFVSSVAIPVAIDPVLQESTEGLLNPVAVGEHDNGALQVAIVFAALSCGSELGQGKALPVATSILQLQFNEDFKHYRNIQASRSIFQRAKWGSLSLLLPKLLETADPNASTELNTFVAQLYEQAIDSVESAPENALVPLFTCVVTAANNCLLNGKSDDGSDMTDVRPLARFISALFDLMDGSDNSNDSMYMMDEICSLIFQPELLLAEYNRHKENPEVETPIRDAFRRFIAMAGTQRPHLYRVVLCRICPAWLAGNATGSTAIPYRDDLVNLLVHKEDIVPVASAYTQGGNNKDLPFSLGMKETSVARGILLVFLSKFPAPTAGTDQTGAALSPIVHEHLLCYIIQRLIELVARPPIAGSGLIMLGTTEYCIKMRALQALCVLSRFVTADIAHVVCAGCIDAMGKQNAHNQLRYFVEIFTLQFARMFPAVFGQALIEQLSRTDLSLQMVASLMIITGNLIVGRYEKDFFLQYDGGKSISLHSILAGVLPWLASTQGFTRAIAQLLVHKLIPRLIDISVTEPGDDSSFYLRSMYRFLDENPEMRRLRNKQAKFFERYKVDSVCTPEGVLSIPVDESKEADPVHLVDVIKDCLQEVYEEAHVDRTPMWRQFQVAEDEAVTTSSGVNDDSLDGSGDTNEMMNFQRKIIPLDALNLALEGIREKRLRNIAGRCKQNLIVCASLIDKIPNLGGLARTCEIFAAKELVVPDIQITKMDNFNSMSVGAGEWIEISECREQNLLAWLRHRKQEGYYIVGLEQTSSSVSLATYRFGVNNQQNYKQQPTVLLLGKEKEGIPVEFLQAVDQCLEIPQFGIIRSLNVHVSAAIAIWEFTKQRLLTPSLAPA